MSYKPNNFSHKKGIKKPKDLVQDIEKRIVKLKMTTKKKKIEKSKGKKKMKEKEKEKRKRIRKGKEKRKRINRGKGKIF